MKPAKLIKLRATWTFDPAKDLSFMASPALESAVIKSATDVINEYKDSRYRVLHVISEYVLGKNDNTRNNKVSI